MLMIKICSNKEYRFTRNNEAVKYRNLENKYCFFLYIHNACFYFLKLLKMYINNLKKLSTCVYHDENYLQRF